MTVELRALNRRKKQCNDTSNFILDSNAVLEVIFKTSPAFLSVIILLNPKLCKTTKCKIIIFNEIAQLVSIVLSSYR